MGMTDLQMLQRQTILVVDDVKENTKMLSALLSKQARILFSLSGKQALDIIEREIPDLILLDVVMPDLSGYDVCRKLKSDPRTQDIPIIFVTGLSDEEDEEVGLSMGAIDYIIKPYKPAVVEARVSNILRLQAMSKALRDSNEELQRLATTDPLTGIANRRHFLSQANIEISRSLRGGHEMALVMIDLDRFKQINDTYGHDVGDKALIATVETLQKSLRDSDVLGRFGGEEFAMYLPETGEEGAVLLANRLREKIAECVVPTPQGDLSFTCSMGIHVVQSGTETVDEALIKADSAMYSAKSNGRNQVVVYTDTDTKAQKAL